RHSPKRPPDDLAVHPVPIPETDDPPAIDDRVIRQIDERARRLLLLPRHITRRVRIVQMHAHLTPHVDHVVEARPERHARLLRHLHRQQTLLVLRQHHPLPILERYGHRLHLRRRRARRLYAEPRPPRELRDRRRPRPPEKPIRERDRDLVI